VSLPYQILLNSPLAPACWIRLGEKGDDDVGDESLVRDCSCRGESAGYAHKSCIINYAIVKSKQDTDDLSDFEAWRVCPNCNQQYQNVLRLELTRELVKFAEANHGNQGRNGVWKMIDASKVMVALRTNIQAMQDILTGKNNMNVKDAKSGVSEANNNEKKIALRVECEQVVNKFLSLTLQVMKDKKMNGWIHLPSTSTENKVYKEMREFEAYALVVLGWLYNFDATKESYEIALKKWAKAKVIFKLLGDEVQSDNMAINISLNREKQRGMGKTASSGLVGAPLLKRNDKARLLTSSKSSYEQNIQSYGNNDERTIYAGIEYAGYLSKVGKDANQPLQNATYHIEAERLITKLSASSLQVLGHEHDYTKKADVLMNHCKGRFVSVMGQFCTHFEALRYEDDGDTLVVNGPIQEPRNRNEEQESRFTSAVVIPMIGCPVVCHGLTGATHLNGKLGEIKGISLKHFQRLLVAFEDSSLKHSLVKLENLRIVFDLPNKAEAEM
jgi:hypothetical protein